MKYLLAFAIGFSLPWAALLVFGGIDSHQPRPVETSTVLVDTLRLADFAWPGEGTSGTFVLYDDSPCPPPTSLQCLGLLLNEGYFVLPYNAELQRWTWSPPSTGTQESTYLCQVEFEMMSMNPAMEFIIIGPSGPAVTRVAGIDSTGRVGPWSEWGTE